MIAESVKTGGASDGAEEAQLDFTVRTAEPAEAPVPATVKTKLPVLRDLSQDTAFSGKYEFIDTIGSGGMGTVYRARQVHLDKMMAVKMMHHSDTCPETLTRFRQEAMAASNLNHPNLLAFRDFGVMTSGCPYLVMDFIKGKTLADRIKESPLELDEAFDTFEQVLSGLEHAHERGVLHRDIKPSNIMLSEDDLLHRVKIVDFGIAKSTNAGQNLTQTGEIFGTPLYMSPEQGRGQQVDARSDLYSLGCVMYEALTGVPPFKGDTALETIYWHQVTPTPTLSKSAPTKQFSLSLERFMAKLLAKNPSDRFQSASAAKEQLLALKTNAGPAAVDQLMWRLTEAWKQKTAVTPGQKGVLATIESIIIKTFLIGCLFVFGWLTIICSLAILSK
jgi:serine/threonine protein kinase